MVGIDLLLELLRDVLVVLHHVVVFLSQIYNRILLLPQALLQGPNYLFDFVVVSPLGQLCLKIHSQLISFPLEILQGLFQARPFLSAFIHFTT